MTLRGLTVDNGGFGVRYQGFFTPKQKDDVTLLNNTFSVIPNDKFRVKDIEDKLSVVCILEAPSDDFKKIIAYGDTVVQYSGTSFSMKSGERKTDSLSYYLQFLYAVSRDAITASMSSNMPVTASQNVSSVSDLKQIHKITSSDVGFSYVITTLIPLREHSGDADCVSHMKSRLKGRYNVQFPLLDGQPTVAFEIVDSQMGVMPEDGIAMVALKDSVQKDDYSLVLGLGHVTFDICIYRGLQLASSVKSESNAGSTLISLIKDALADNGYFVSEDRIGNIIETGFTKDGTQDVDVSHIVEAQKRVFVTRYLKDSIVSLLNASKLSARQIQNIVPTGNLANDTLTGSIVDMVIQELGFNNVEVKRVTKDLKLANLTLASLFTEKIFSRFNK